MLTADALSQSDLAAIARVRDAWLRAIDADDLAGLEAPTTDDFVALPPNEKAQGRSEQRESHRARISQFHTRLNMKSEEVLGGGIWAIERMSYTMELVPRASGPALSDSGNCLWTWQRQSDGSWKVARAIWNSDVPLAAAGSEADAAAIRRVADDYTVAINAGSVDGLAATVAPDIVVMPPDAPLVSGVAAVREWFKTQFVDPFHVNLTFTFTELDLHGDVAIAYGPFQLTLTPRDGSAAIRITGKYIDVYRRQPDASWKFSRVIFNSDAPAA